MATSLLPADLFYLAACSDRPDGGIYAYRLEPAEDRPSVIT